MFACFSCIRSLQLFRIRNRVLALLVFEYIIVECQIGYDKSNAVDKVFQAINLVFENILFSEISKYAGELTAGLINFLG